MNSAHGAQDVLEAGNPIRVHVCTRALRLMPAVCLVSTWSIGNQLHHNAWDLAELQRYRLTQL